MTQSSDLGAILNVPGATFRQRVNAGFQSLASSNYGPGEPTPVYPNMEWYGSATGRIKQRNRDNTAWIDAGPIGEVATALGWRVLWPTGSDDTVQINAALATGASVFLMPGVWVTAGNHTIVANGQRVAGSPAAPTLIMHTSQTGNLFNVGQAGVITSRIRFDDFYVWAPTAKTSGYVFNCQNIQQCHWRNICAGTIEDLSADGHRLCGGWLINGFFRCSIDRTNSCTVLDNGIVAFGNNTSGGAELEIEADIVSCGTNGVLIGGGAGGVYFGGEISQCRTGVRLTSALSGVLNREIFFNSRAIVDSNADYGLIIENSGAAIVDVDGAWFSSTGRIITGAGVGIYVAPDAGSFTRLNMIGGRLYNNTAAAANFAAGDIGVRCVDITGNGDGIVLPTSGLVHADIIGNVFRAQSGSDIVMPDPAMASFVISQNNITRGIINASAVTPQRQIYDNRGYATVAGGQATVLTGALFVDVPHGLAIAPGNHHIQLTPATGSAGAQDWWVSNADGLNFRINVGTPPASNIVFYWRADVGEFY